MHLSADQWTQAFEDSPVPMALVRPDHSFAQCNRAYCALLGYTEEQLARRKWPSVTHPDDVDGDMAGAEQIARERSRQSYVIDKRYIAQSGYIVPVRLGVCGVIDERGGFAGYFIAAFAHPDWAGSEHEDPRPTPGLWQWVQEHPKDAIIVGLSAFILLGREAVIEMLKVWVKG